MSTAASVTDRAGTPPGSTTGDRAVCPDPGDLTLDVGTLGIYDDGVGVIAHANSDLTANRGRRHAFYPLCP